MCRCHPPAPNPLHPHPNTISEPHTCAVAVPNERHRKTASSFPFGGFPKRTAFAQASVRTPAPILAPQSVQPFVRSSLQYFALRKRSGSFGT